MNRTTGNFICNAFLLLCLFIGSHRTMAQTYPVQVQPSVSFPSSFLSDYNDPSNVSVRVYLSDVTKTNYRIRLKVRLTSNDYGAVSKDGISLTLQGGQFYFLNDQELAELFNVNNLSGTKNVNTATENFLPEGIYHMFFEAFDATLPGGVVVSNERTDFTVFSVNRYDPPLLATPTNKQEFDVATINQNIFFNWTPRHVVFSPKQQVKYRFRMVKVLPVDRNPNDAINTISPATIDVKGLDFPVFIYSPADLVLEEGCVYAWQVTAYEEVMNGAKLEESPARFKRLGMSEVFTLSIKENCQPVTPIASPTVGKNLIALKWNFDPSHKEYEIAYRPLGTSLPWNPVGTLNNLINLDNTVLQRGVQYEYTVKAKCKNWLEPAYGGTFTLPEATCNAPTPVTVDNSDPSGTKLSWTSVNGVSGYRFQYRNLADAAFTTVDLTSADTEYTLPKLTSGGYKIKVDGVCGTEFADGIPNDVAFDETGLVGPCPIPVPFQLVATRTQKLQAQLVWPLSPAHTAYSITYWHRDSSDVKFRRTLTSTVPQVLADFVYDDQLYNYQITFICGSKNTTTPVGLFRIEANGGGVVTDPPTGNCFPPAVVQAEPRSTSSAQFDWAKVDGVDGYQLMYSVKGANKFVPFNTIATSEVIKNLEDSKQYQFVVRSRCGNKYSIPSDTGLVDLAGGKQNVNCDSSTYFITKGQTTTEIRLCWHYDAKNTGYKLTFREEAQSPADEYTEAFTDIAAFKLAHLSKTGDTLKYTKANLKPGTVYIFKLQVLCGTEEALRNAPLKVSTVHDAKTSGECGKGQLCDKTNVTPLPSLAQGDSIHCADYAVLVDKVTASDPATGTYSGSGFMNMPMPGLSDFVRMSVSFNNVKINAKPNSCIYDGIINIDSINASALPIELRNKVKSLEGQIDNAITNAQNTLTQVQEGIDAAQEAVQTATDYFQGGDGVGNVSDGGLGEATTTQTLSAPSTVLVSGGTATVGGVVLNNLPRIIKDGTGNVFQVDGNGNVIHVGEYDPTLAGNPTLDLTDGRVVYAEYTPSKYDFDEWKSQYSGKLQIEREYEKIGTDYYVPAKLILPGQLDKVNAIVQGSYDKSKIKFANGKGMVYDHTPSGNTFTINVAGGPASDGQYIYAWFIDGSTKKAIGKLLVPSYAPQEKKVVIIPMGKAEPRITSTVAKYETTLNDVYGKLGIHYTVSVDASFKNNLNWDEGHDTGEGDGLLVPKGSKLTSNEYKGEEAAIINTYVAFKGGESQIDESTAYFFAMYEAPSADDELVGKMPATEQFGFLFAGAATDALLARTMAHELGHGAYHLEHTFIALYLGQSSQGKSDNIMDYNNNGDSKNVWKYQWDVIHDPGHVWGILKRDKDSEAKKDRRKEKFCDFVAKLPSEKFLGTYTPATVKDCDDYANDKSLTEIENMFNMHGSIAVVDNVALAHMKYYAYKLYCAGVLVNVHQYGGPNFPKEPASTAAAYTIYYSSIREFTVVSNPASHEQTNNYSGIGRAILKKNKDDIVCAFKSVCKQISFDLNLKKSDGSNLFLPHSCYDGDPIPPPPTLPCVTLSKDVPSVSEFDQGTAMITATLTYPHEAASNKDVVVTLDLSGRATYSTDYTFVKTITIPAGQTSVSVPLTAIKDTDVEVDGESVVIQTFVATNANICNTFQEQEVLIVDFPRSTLAEIKNVRTYIEAVTGKVRIEWDADGSINEFKYKAASGNTYITKTPTCSKGHCTVSFGNPRLGSEVEYKIVTKNNATESPTPLIAKTADFHGPDHVKTLCDKLRGDVGDENTDLANFTFEWKIDKGTLPSEFADKQAQGANATPPYPFVEFNYDGKHTYTLVRTHMVVNTPIFGGVIDHGNVLVDPLMDCSWRIIAIDKDLPAGSGQRRAYDGEVLQLVEKDNSPYPANGLDASVVVDDPPPSNAYGDKYPKWYFDGSYNSSMDRKLTYDIVKNSYPSPANATADNGIAPMGNDYKVVALDKPESVRVEYFKENRVPLLDIPAINDPAVTFYENFFEVCGAVKWAQDQIDRALGYVGLPPGTFTLPITCTPVIAVDRYTAERWNDPRVVTDQSGVLRANFGGALNIPMPLGATVGINPAPVIMNYDKRARQGLTSRVNIPDSVWPGNIQRCFGPDNILITCQYCLALNFTFTLTTNTTIAGCKMQIDMATTNITLTPTCPLPASVLAMITPPPIPAASRNLSFCLFR